MGFTNFVLTVVGVSVVLLVRSNWKQSAYLFSIKRNVKHIRHWLEEETAASAKVTEKSTPKEPKSNVPSEDNHKD